MFGENLRALRTQCNLKQTELAEMAGIRPHTLWRYENGDSEPSFQTLLRLVDALSRALGRVIATEELTHGAQRSTAGK